MEDVDDAVQALAGPLRVLVTVADHRHVTRAAHELGLGQPTVSRALARVQEVVGVPLLAPHGRGVRLTAAGHALAAAARRALGEVERGVRAVREDDSPATGRVALGFLHTLGAAAVPALVRAFREEHPGARFRLTQGAAGALLAQLTAGDVDLVLTSPLPAAPGLRARALLEQPLVLCLPAEHRLARREHLALADVAGEPFVLFEHGYGLRETADAMFAEAGVRPAVAFEGQDAGTVRGLVAAGLGVALLPAPGPARAGVVERPLSGPSTTRTLGIVQREGPLPRVAAAFRDLVLARPELLGRSG
ncbi:LysR family transcriptional regulator [Kineococcus indalonis]|uniref:LysR family transcriptional regulator n=1 Tax=Kineococcus indalonis TaxID=2696566 RepID=UPI00196A68FA|nr:LysR family transcriptional regulator [Kineococcus indalonis]